MKGKNDSDRKSQLQLLILWNLHTYTHIHIHTYMYICTYINTLTYIHSIDLHTNMLKE